MLESGTPDPRKLSSSVSTDLGRTVDAARIVLRSADGPTRPTDVPLFAVTSNGRLSIAADGSPLDVRAGDTVIVLTSQR